MESREFNLPNCDAGTCPFLLNGNWATNVVYRCTILMTASEGKCLVLVNSSYKFLIRCFFIRYYIRISYESPQDLMGTRLSFFILAFCYVKNHE